jgi:hypothetical protein
MIKKILILLFSIAFIAIFQMSTYAEEFPGPDTSPDGLELTNFYLRRPQSPKVGDTIIVSFSLKNVTNHNIQLDSRYGMFVGARWNSTTDANNRDFGYLHKGETLSPNQQVSVKASRKLDAAGTWRFWPAYMVSGKWGPFRWHEIVVEVVAAGTPGSPPTKPPAKGR